LRNLADAHLKVGQPERAREFAEAGIAIAQDIAYELGEAIGCFHLGRALWALNQHSEGRTEVERALAVFERLGDEERVKEAREKLAEWDDPPPAEPAPA
jgi:hypothetical protein